MNPRIAKLSLVAAAALLALAALFVSDSRAQVDVNAIQNQINALYDAGRHAEASALAERFVPLVVQIYGQGGREHADSLNKLGWAYAGEGRSAEAIRMFEQSLPMAERAFGPSHWIIGMISNNLANEYEEIGKIAEAEALWRRGIAVYERDIRDNEGLLASSLGNLGRMYISQGRLRDAEPLFERSFRLAERMRKDPEYLALALNNLGELREKQGRPAEAEQLLRRSLAVREKAYGANHTMTARGLTNLATFYDTQSRISDSYPLLLRSLDIQLNALGIRHPEVARVLERLAANSHLYSDKKGVELVEKLLNEQLAYFEKQGPNSPELDGVLEGLSTFYRQSGRYKDQEPVVQRRLAYAQKAFGRDSLQVGELLSSMAGIYADQGRYKEALDVGRRGLAIRERYHGPNGAQTIHSHGNLAAWHMALKDWRSAAAELRTVVTYLAKRERGAELSRSSSKSQQGLWIDQSYTHALIQVLHRLGASDAAIIDESFQTAQLALLSDAGASLARMSARVAAGNDALPGLVRERQDLVVQRTATDKQLLELALKDVDKAAPKVRETLNRSLSELDAKLNKMDARIRTEYPAYTNISDPEPLTIKAAQATLGAQEALVVFLDAPVTKNVENESYVWTVTKTDVRWTRLAAAPKVLQDKVRLLRCGLDQDGEWELSVEKERWIGRHKACQELRPAGLAKDEPLPFELARSHDLYKELLGPSEGVLKNADGSWKRLIVVPSASLAALPFQVLVTEAPEVAQGADYAAAKWLAARQAISVLPSVVSLKVLRDFAHTSKATAAFVGFGNPLIQGADGSDKRAWQRQSCNAKSGGQVKVASRRVDRTKTKFFRGELADVEAIRAQPPLPETAGELCEVAASLNAGDDAVYLGAKATERTIKTLSANGTLARARVLHFATHGLLATESKSVAGAADEPGLLLTPPRKATEEDDGLLTASEVAQLKLDADWVVLSACNTAGGGSTLEAEPLSGLARAFFYAGTRAILVSHWYVDSEAAVALVTKTFSELEAKPDIGRAEALRRSMLALIGKGGGRTHPAQWAPFVVVGEGAR